MAGSQAIAVHKLTHAPCQFYRAVVNVFCDVTEVFEPPGSCFEGRLHSWMTAEPLLEHTNDIWTLLQGEALHIIRRTCAYLDVRFIPRFGRTATFFNGLAYATRLRAVYDDTDAWRPDFCTALEMRSTHARAEECSEIDFSYHTRSAVSAGYIYGKQYHITKLASYKGFAVDISLNGCKWEENYMLRLPLVLEEHIRDILGLSNEMDLTHSVRHLLQSAHFHPAPCQ